MFCFHPRFESRKFVNALVSKIKDKHSNNTATFILSNANNLAGILADNTKVSDETRTFLYRVSKTNDKLLDKIIDKTNQLKGKVKANADNDDNDKERKLYKQSKKILGKQNQTIEDIVNDTLYRLPKNIAGTIRNTIAKSPNKLITLQNKLDKRNIHM